MKKIGSSHTAYIMEVSVRRNPWNLPLRETGKTESPGLSIKGNLSQRLSSSFLFFFVRRHNSITRVAWTSTAISLAFSDVLRCQLRHRRRELHIDSYLYGSF